ncbi:hypothetical protein A1O1_00473 [Capronia coronata CBS 617.96]|uniref:Checkpoint protein RAD24-like helical bundle domain-containing protein n=1 Tax=Capronia coronata CBS 617.96 TaxID=1182541 RepID=W9YS63_9EURO|nr:uncharacterized protein A1O1_00473 [Capronia coronata CBS 617.96]EXJ95353.1 hypothetical protein A1O1_00473 [Capronia coronata CBS 617.96]
MAPRPAKRQRRSTIILSDDSDDDFEVPSSKAPKAAQREITLDGKTSLTTSPAKAGKGRPTTRRAAPKPSPKSSPEKARKSTKPTEPEKSKSLHSFFGKISEEERWRKKSATPELDWANGELDDAIEDDELSDKTLQELGVKTDNASVSSGRLKPQPLAPPITKQKGEANGGSLAPSQRFFKPATSGRPTTSTRADKPQPVAELHHLPWADRYGPSNLEELVVHKKKVADVQGWLQGKITGRNNQKLLILKGPAGSGKTTTLALLAKAMGLHLVPWHNPVVSDSGANSSIAHQFDEFLNRGGQFGSLAFDHDSLNSTSPVAEPGHRVLVVEEFPATISTYSGALQSFRSVILQFLARSKTVASTFPSQHHSDESAPPLVMIISETLLSSSTAMSDSFTAHRLLGPDILNHPFVTVMDFNPVAATFVTKALDLVMKKEARDSRRRRMPGPAVMQRLAEMGDVRSAVNSLEFLCLRGGDGSEWSGTIAAKPKKTAKDKDRIPLTEMEKNSLQLVTQRETTLDMFHAAGKIVYNKREDPRVLDTRAEPPPKPPDHLMHSYTPKASQVDIEALLNETGTDIQTFISTLHQNYILSCNGDSFEESFDGCADILSTTDILNPESRPSRRATSNPNASLVQASLQAGSSDTLRQDEISFHVATRGLLFNLPYPVNRASPPGGKKGDAFKMFYPASLRLWKPREEMESLIDMFVHGSGSVSGFGSGFGNSSALPTAAGAGNGRGGDGGVASWQSRAFGPTSAPTIKSEPGLQGDDSNDDSEESLDPRPVHRPKDTLVCEMLPYMTRILGARKQHDTPVTAISTTTTNVLERITRFKPGAFLTSATGEEVEAEADAERLDADDHDNLAHAATGSASKIGTNTMTGPTRANATTNATSYTYGSVPSVVAAGPNRGRGPSINASTSTTHGNRTGNTQGQLQGHGNEPSTSMTVTVEKLYISDDDIEDD